MTVTENPLLLEEINQINMNILTSGYAVLDKEWNYKNIRSPFTRIYFVRSGEGVLSYGETSISLLPDNIYIIPAGLEISLRCESKMEKLFFHFNLQRMSIQDLFQGYEKCIVLRNRKANVDYAIRHWQRGDAEGAIAIKNLLYSLCFSVIKREKISFGKTKNYSTLTKRSIDYIENNLHASLTADDIASSLYVSSGSLQKRFRREVGIPLGKYINSRIMFRAERMLHSHEFSIKEISEQLGFCDQFYFSRVFTACYGISPTQYKKNIRI